MATVGGDPWKISGEERAKHDAQFFSLKPVNGYVTGGQARDFFMQSGLSTQMLGQIWTLADMNNDGKMDKLEFSVAMHLIKKKLQGYELPKVLPASLKVAPSPVIGSFGMQAGPMAMGTQVVMGMAPANAMNPPMGMPLSGGMMPQASLGTSTMTTGSVGMPLMANGMGPAQGMQGMGMGFPPAQAAGVGASGWSMPHPNKLKYTQLFNTHDRNKRGFLTGVEARGILMQSGLPQTVLAQIWMLSDVDGDGKLTTEEFCISMHLSDMARLGRALPPKLPAELMPSKARSGSMGPAAGMPGGIAGGMPASMAPPIQGVPQQKESFGDLLSGMGIAPPPIAQPGLPGAEALIEDMSPATFEDKRKMNFDKGQAELERRRALLQEQLKAEENARLEKERREQEKRERFRLEQEAKRQEELHRQMERQRKVEMERDEQRRKMMEQREQAKRELERQHQMEWERQRKEQLMGEKQRELEQLTSLKTQSTNLKGQLESLDGKKAELALKVSQVRTGVTDLTSSIESMRVQRDTTTSDIDRAERETTELNQKLSQLNGDKEQLQIQIQTQQNTPLSDSHRTVMHSVELKRTNIQKLRRELEQFEQGTETKLVDIDNANIQLKSLQSLVEQLQNEIPTLQKKQQEAKNTQDLQRAAKERERQELKKKELEEQRKREEAEKASATASVNGDSSKPDNWFAFDSGGGSAATGQGSGSGGDAWGNAFGSPAATTTSAAPANMWASSDPFASQTSGDSTIKKSPYKILFPFESRSEDELTVNPGDNIMVWDVPSEPGMEEWYKGDVDGVVGWFPQAYAEPLPEPQAQPQTSAFSSQPQTADVFGSAFQPVQQTSSHASPAPSAGSGATTPKPTGPPVAEAAFQPTPGEAHKAPEGLKAQALYQWKARQDNHLSFNKDDVISVKEQEDMWWMGQLGATVGWFPKAYVKLLETERLSLSGSQTSSPMGTLEKNGSGGASPAPERKDGEYYVATYSYSSGESTDLSFNEGDMILVTGKEDDWWTGTLGDKTGIFPASYVKKVEIQTSGSIGSAGLYGGTLSSALGSDQLGGGLQSLGVEDGLFGNAAVTPVAPPRRARSKKGSVSEVAFAQSTDNTGFGSGEVDFGADFAQSFPSTPAVPQPKVAPPRRRRNTKGSDMDSSPSKEVPAITESQIGALDSEANVSDAFPPQFPEKPFADVDFASAFQNKPPTNGEDAQEQFPGRSSDMTPPQPSEVNSSNDTSADFAFGADPFPSNVTTAERGGTNPADLFDFGASFSDQFPTQQPGFEGGEDPFAAVSDPFPTQQPGFEGGEDPFAAVSDPFPTQQPGFEGGEDPFAAVSDPFPTQQPGFEGGEDPFAAVSDPFPTLQPGFEGGEDPFADISDPFPAQEPSFKEGDDPFAAVSEPLGINSIPDSDVEQDPSENKAQLSSDLGNKDTADSTGIASSSMQPTPVASSNSSSSLSDMNVRDTIPASSAVPAKKTEAEDADKGGLTTDPQSQAASGSSSSLFGMDFGSLMSAASPIPFNKPLESVKALDRGSPALSTSPPAAATFYISDSSMSASSSAAELSTLAEEATMTSAMETPDAFAGQGDPPAAEANPMGDPPSAAGSKVDPFASLFKDGPAVDAGSAFDPAQSPQTGGPSPSLSPPSGLMIGAEGNSEPAELPPPPPSPECVSVSLEVQPDIPAGSPTFCTPEGERGGAAAESDEPGQKSAKKPEIAMVIAPYVATGNGQLSLESGNLIHVRQKSPRGWWEGELQARGQRKKIGWFPANYVKLLGSSGSARSTPDPNATLSAGAQQSGGSRSSTPQPQPTTAAPPLPPQQAERMVALYAYTAQNEDELTFEKDAVITVINKDNPDWWQGEVNGQTGVFPLNYVVPLSEAQQSWLSDSVRGKLSGAEKQRQNYIQELITTEETYNADMSIVIEVFLNPLLEAGVLTPQESETIFVNWNELIICNKKFLQAVRVRKKMCGKGKVIFMIGDILCENMPHMTPYVRFCSRQLTAAALLQRKTENDAQFVEVHKKCVTNPAAKGMPLSSFLLKPMQRITKYPLLIKEILKHTPSDHADVGNLEDALQRAEELCNQVNEGVRERENSDRLEWIQRHVHCDGLAENITFNSVTNCLGSRKLLHCGVVNKVKSNKELLAMLFNDFLLLTIPPRVLGPVASTSYIFDSKSKDQYKMYKTPIVLNEVVVKKPADADADPCQFQVSHIERVYHFKAPNESERDLWIKHIDSATRHFWDTEKKKRDRAHSLKCKPEGRLLVIIEEGIRLRSTTESGKSDPYCEVSMGSQEHRTRVVNNTLNPKWNASMQFTIRDLRQDVLCITAYDRDLYSPNDFLGRTEVRMSEILEEARIKKGPITKRMILHEVDTGEVIVKLDLQLYES